MDNKRISHDNSLWILYRLVAENEIEQIDPMGNGLKTLIKKKDKKVNEDNKKRN